MNEKFEIYFRFLGKLEFYWNFYVVTYLAIMGFLFSNNNFVSGSQINGVLVIEFNTDYQTIATDVCAALMPAPVVC